MKKFFALILILNFFSLNLFAAEDLVSDHLVDLLDKNLKINKTEPSKISDDFASKTLNPNLKIEKQAPIVYQDSVVEKMSKNFTYSTGDKKQKFDFENLDEKVVKISPQKYYTTRKNLNEGELLNFVLVQDVTIKNKLYKKGTPVLARVENLSANSAYGVPADLVIDNFVLAPDVKLNGQIEKKGANRTLWLYPTSVVLLPFFGAGLLLLPIRGGHAKLKPKHIYELTYVE